MADSILNVFFQATAELAVLTVNVVPEAAVIATLVILYELDAFDIVANPPAVN